MNLGQRLSEARKNANLSQAQVAEKLFVTPQSVSAWECGNTVPDVEKFPMLSELYHVTTDWLLTGQVPSNEILEVTSKLSNRLFDEKRMYTYIGSYCIAKELYQTKRALSYAREKHDGQFRKTGHTDEPIPYIYHPLLMTCHALAMGMEEDALLAVTLLHDVCEDCGVTPEELPVSEEVKVAVDFLTKKSGLSTIDYYEAISKNRLAAMVKLLDRCNNVSSMASGFSNDKIAQYTIETEEYVYPLMEKARNYFPEYSNPLFLIRYHMKSVLEALKHQMKENICV